YDDAISHYSGASSLISSSPKAILLKQSKAWLATGSWKQALQDANQVPHSCLIRVHLYATITGSKGSASERTGRDGPSHKCIDSTRIGAHRSFVVMPHYHMSLTSVSSIIGY
ncbi:hypothetical protein EV363DRAFT_1171636, partial [Boletus edulis]